MSYEGDDTEHELEVEDANEQIIVLLRRAVALLEVIANLDTGESEDFIE